MYKCTINDADCKCYDKSLCINQYKCEFRKLIEHEEIVSALEKQLNGDWISVKEMLPETNKDVQITIRRKNGARGLFVTNAVYIPPYTIKVEDFMDWEIDFWDYEDKTDTYWTVSGWYEQYCATGIDYSGMYLDGEFDILAWQPLSEPYKEN